MLHFPTADSLAFWRQQLPFGRTEEFPKETVLIREGSRPRYIFLIDSGIVDLTVSGPITASKRSVTWCGPGHLIGRVTAVLGIPSPATFTTATNCSVRRLPMAEFVRVIRPSQPSALWKLCEERTWDMVGLVQSFALTASVKARDRLELVLARLQLQQYGPDVGHPVVLERYSPTNEQLGGYIGVSPTYVTRLFGELEKARIARRLASGKIRIDQPTRLKQVPRVRSPNATIAEWKHLLPINSPLNFSSGHTLFRQGELIEGIYLLEDGVVDFSIPHPLTDQPQPVLWVSAGHLTGDCFALTAAPSPLTAITATDCRINHLPTERFLAALDLGSQPLLGQFVALLNRDLIALATRIMLDQILPLEKRLEYLIWQLGKRYFADAAGRGIELEAFSPNTIMYARYLSTREDYVRVLLRRLEHRGAILRRDRNTLIVKKPNKLFHLNDPYIS